MKKKNGFTLIELLAIIVILAIIAVITVPIILNIIENSRRGAATDSAYGYKDAVNKWFVSKLQDDNQYQLADSYTISSDGKLGTIAIPVSGDKPSGGCLNYSNNTLTGGCLKIGDYAVTFDSNGNASKTEKGACPENLNIEDTCPGENCYYGTDFTDDLGNDLLIGSTLSNTYSTNYQDLGNFFLGFKINNNNDKKITRSYACGISDDNVLFCIEGGQIGNNTIHNLNISIISNVLGTVGQSFEDGEICYYDTDINAHVFSDGSVIVAGEGTASVGSDGSAYWCSGC